MGYVLGTRAGRQRYEQIKKATEKLWNTPTVQQGVDQVKGFAAERVGTVTDAVFDGAKKLVKAATNQTASRGSSYSPAPSPTASPTVATVDEVVASHGTTQTGNSHTTN